MVTPREAATVMLVRDDPDLEVFMLRRSLNADWVGGAYVFPGGAVDDGDRAPEVLARCPDRSDDDASTRLGVASGGLGYWVAAVRETFEEAGVLLARDANLPGAVGVCAHALSWWSTSFATRSAIPGASRTPEPCVPVTTVTFLPRDGQRSTTGLKSCV